MGTLRHIRDAQRLRLEAQACRLAQEESRLVQAQIVLRHAQARLAIDRVRFAVHDLLGVFHPPADAEQLDEPEAAPPTRLRRVK